MTREEKPRSIIFVVATIAAASSISMLGGIAIEVVADKLIPIIPLVIAMPTLNTMVGDYATIVASYEQAGAQGSIRRSLYQAISKSVAINVVALIILSLGLAIKRGYEIDAGFATKYSLFIAASTILTVVSVFVIAKTLSRILKNNHLNADDVLIPVITSVTDALMLTLISISVLTIF
jgi:cation transporter-like permease